MKRAYKVSNRRRAPSGALWAILDCELTDTIAMPDPTNPPSSTDSAPVSGRDPKPTRRRFLQGGLAAAPVLMTLVSRPVLAQQCTTPSGFVSLGASTAGRGVTCIGHMPSFWANPANFSQWPSGFNPIGPQATLFGPPQGVFANSPYVGDPTLLDVLNAAATPHNLTTDKTAMFVAAALLNAAAGLTPTLLLPAVRDIWSEYGATGYGIGGSFSPSSGAHWNPLEINEYLMTTMA
jgi:hypothetical protein